MTPRYEPHEIEAKWQRVWEDERAFNVPNPVPGAPTAENHWYQLEMLPYPSGPSLHMGHVLNYTMGDVQTHVRRRSGWHVVRPMGWDAFGLPAENAAIREGAPSAGDDQPEHRDDARPDEAPGLGDRLGARGRSAPADLLPLDAVAVPAVRRTRPLLPPGGAGQLVPQRPDGDRERVRRRRPLRALRRRGRAPEHDAVVHADDRVRRRAARVRPAGGRLLARADEGDPAQLDRPLRGRRDPLPRRGDRGGRRRSSRRAPTRCTARRSSSWRPSIRSSPSRRARRRRSTRATPARGRSRSARRGRRRPASSPASTWSTRSTASGCRSGSPTTS